jgi:hypothetical protein
LQDEIDVQIAALPRRFTEIRLGIAIPNAEQLSFAAV